MLDFNMLNIHPWWLNAIGRNISDGKELKFVWYTTEYEEPGGYFILNNNVWVYELGDYISKIYSLNIVDCRLAIENTATDGTVLWYFSDIDRKDVVIDLPGSAVFETVKGYHVVSNDPISDTIIGIEDAWWRKHCVRCGTETLRIHDIALVKGRLNE